jgi:leucyl aminopeptidase
MQIQEATYPLEEVDADVLLLFHPEDEPAPRGRLGWVDWILCGPVSRLRARGKFAGERGANVLLSSNGKLRARMILVIGLGRQADLSMVALYRLSYLAAHAIVALGCTRVAMEPPSRAFPREPPTRIRQAFLEGFTAEVERGRPDASFTLTVLSPPDAP